VKHNTENQIKTILLSKCRVCKNQVQSHNEE